MRGAGRPRSTRARRIAIAAACAVVSAATARADGPATLEVDAGKPGVAIPAGFFGLMTEEINHSYDGGLFAELIQNRTFQDPPPRPPGGGPGPRPGGPDPGSRGAGCRSTGRSSAPARRRPTPPTR